MSALSIRLPNSLHERVRELAAREGISINQLVATALAEKMSALMTADYLEARAQRGSRAKFAAALARVPDVEPDPWDRRDERPGNKRLPSVRQPAGRVQAGQPRAKMAIRLFDETVRTDLAFARYSERGYEYWNKSARPEIAAIRDVLEAWFVTYPDSEKEKFKCRFATDNYALHQPAFFELYVHALLERLGFEVEVLPNREGIKTPDFLVSAKGQKLLFIEAVVAGAHGSDPGTAKRQDRIRDILNTISSPNFWLEIEFESVPRLDLSRERITQAIQEWVNGLDPHPDETEAFPTRVFDEEDFRLEVTAIPKAPEARGDVTARPVGIERFGVGVIDDVTPLRKSLRRKFGRYGRLGLPYVVAMNALGESVGQQDIQEALFGTLRIAVVRRDPGASRLVRGDDGLWGSRSYRRVSAVLSVCRLRPDSLVTTQPILWINPWAECQLSENRWPLAKRKVGSDGRFLEQPAAKGMTAVFELSEDWPSAGP